MWRPAGMQAGPLSLSLNTSTSFCAGVLYYGNQAGNKIKPSDFIDELSTQSELDKWLKNQKDNELKILNVCLTSATPCVHIFPAVLALARNMDGAASFARLVADSNGSSGSLAKAFNVTQVNTWTL